MGRATRRVGGYEEGKQRRPAHAAPPWGEMRKAVLAAARPRPRALGGCSAVPGAQAAAAGEPLGALLLLSVWKGLWDWGVLTDEPTAAPGARV